MPTTKESAAPRANNSESGGLNMNGPSSEVIDVSDNDPLEAEESATTVLERTVDLTDLPENTQKESSGSTVPARGSDKENGSDESKSEEAKLTKPKVKERRTLRSTKEESEQPENETREPEDVEAEGNEEGDENSDDNQGLSIAMTRSKRSSVRRPIRHGDFDFDYNDSSEYEEDEECEVEEGAPNPVSDGTRSRELRIRVERQRSAVSRTGGDMSNSSVADDGEMEAVGELPSKGKPEAANRRSRKRGSHLDGQAHLKKRRKNAPVHMQLGYLDDEPPNSNGLEEVHLNSAPEHDPSTTNPEPPLDVNEARPDAEALSEGDHSLPPPAPRETQSPQGGDDSDLFCWVCHKYGKVICCETCVRVYHMRCLNLNEEPSDDWFCPECADIMVDAQRSMDPVNDEDMMTSFRLPINKHELAPLLLHAIEMMRAVPSSQPFHDPVDTEDIKDYESYIVNPMSLIKLEENVQQLRYSSTGGFMSDARWILHNCIVYNGANNPLTSISRQILKRCRIEMREIVACPDCYKYQAEATNDNCGADDEVENWFSKVCRIPHPIVWVRLRNYPVWPAKVIEEVQVRDEYRVRTKFFGAHDYAEVPFSCATFHTRVRPPVDSRTLQVEHFKLALEELQEHERLLRQRYSDFVLPSTGHTYIPEIANNFYRLLGSRQKRLVSATIRADGSTTSSSSHGTDNGPATGGGGGLVSSRRSSNESIGNNGAGGGGQVAAAAAGGGGDGPETAASATSENESEEAGCKRNGNQEVSLPTEDGAAAAAAAENAQKEKDHNRVANSSTLAQTIQSAGRRLGVASKPCNGSAVAENVEMEIDEGSVPVTTGSRSVADKGTFTEDLDDIMACLCSTDALDREVLSLSTRDLLSCVRWAGQGGGRSSLLRNGSGASTSALRGGPEAGAGDVATSSTGEDRQRLETLASKRSEETSRLQEENGRLHQCVKALEEQLELLKTKHSRDLKMTEERLTVLYDLKLLEQRHNFDLSLAETRHSYDNDRVKVVHETRRILYEDVKKIVSEVKGKQWCAYCRNEAFYYCCWNTSYCDANCQKKHWTTHMTSCAQTNQQNSDTSRNQVARAPNPQQVNAQHPNQTNMAAQIIPGRRMMSNMPQVNQR